MPSNHADSKNKQQAQERHLGTEPPKSCPLVHDETSTRKAYELQCIIADSPASSLQSRIGGLHFLGGWHESRNEGRRHRWQTSRRGGAAIRTGKAMTFLDTIRANAMAKPGFGM